MSPELLRIRRQKKQRIWRRSIAYSLDLAAFATSAFLAFGLRFDFALPAQYYRPMWVALSIWVAAKLASFVIGAVDRGSWQHTSVHDAVRIISAVSAGSVLGGAVIFSLLGPWGVPRSVYILDWLFSWLLTLGGRLAVRVFVTTRSRSRAEGEQTRTLIYGAGAAGMALLMELRQNQNLMCDVQGIIDDDASKVGLTLHGVRVLLSLIHI